MMNGRILEVLKQEGKDMTNEEIWKKVIDIGKDVFNDDDLELTSESSSNTISSWDSIAHLNLISDLEDAFGIQFTLEEFTSAKNMGELVEIIIKHLG